MALINLTSAQLERLIELIKEKESLQAKLEKVDQSLNQLADGNISRPVVSPGKKGSRQRRGKLKESILELLTGAGKTGLTVKELAAKLGTKPANISVWFYVTGKKIKGIKKIGKAKYAYSAE